MQGEGLWDGLDGLMLFIGLSGFVTLTLIYIIREIYIDLKNK